MTIKLTSDRAGQVEISKSSRDEFPLGHDEEIQMRPLRTDPLLRKELGVWVLQGETHSGIPVPELIDQQRQARIMALLG
jgi:hypothetical protein